jgi:hypothetical protein
VCIGISPFGQQIIVIQWNQAGIDVYVVSALVEIVLDGKVLADLAVLDQAVLMEVPKASAAI